MRFSCASGLRAGPDEERSPRDASRAFALCGGVFSDAENFAFNRDEGRCSRERIPRLGTSPGCRLLRKEKCLEFVDGEGGERRQGRRISEAG
jgi:hypothetical protein